MKILFLCGKYSPGKDGVADYTLRLANHLSKSGHDHLIVSLYSQDNDIVPNTFDITKNVIRISSKSNPFFAISSLSTICKQFQPDFISLQYVPYAFNKKGLPFWLCLIPFLIRYPCKYQLMMHELWVPAANITSKVILHLLTKICTILILKSFKPSILHTSNAYYQGLLGKYGFNSTLLPIFSNIKIVDALYNTDSITTNPSSQFNFLFFGSIRPGWPSELFLRTILRALVYSNYENIMLTSIGKLGHFGEALWSDLSKNKIKNISFSKIGYVDDDEINHYMSVSHAGVCISPVHLLGKSGVAAAFSSFGLPILTYRNKYSSNLYSSDFSTSVFCIEDDLTDLFQNPHIFRHPPHDILQSTSQKFLSDLQNCLS